MGFRNGIIIIISLIILGSHSSLLANNIHKYIATFIKEGELDLDMENEIIGKSLVHPKSDS